MKLILVVSVMLWSLSSCSQHPASRIFTGSTPVDSLSRTILKIPLSDKSEFAKWNLSLKDGAYTLSIEYGMSKAGTHGFLPGSKKIEGAGKYSYSAITKTYSLDNGIKFWEGSNLNILHLLDQNNHLMVGNGGFSYTLNNTRPFPNKETIKITNSKIQASKLKSSIFATFQGRTPCIPKILKVKNGDPSKCQLQKWLMTLYQDSLTGAPTTYTISNIYVGTDDNKHALSGKWTIHESNKQDIIYRLEISPGTFLNFMKGDENILFLLDDQFHLQAGTDYVSYTLSKRNG